MSVDFTMCLSRTQYDEENEKYRQIALASPDKDIFRDDVTNLCDIGDSSFDLAKILNAFEFETIDEDFVAKIERLLKALGTCEQAEIDPVLFWLKKNMGEKYILVAE